MRSGSGRRIRPRAQSSAPMSVVPMAHQAIITVGMKVALITTIFGIVVALILQLFYSYITSKIEHLTSQMEESVVTLLDIIMAYKHQRNG